MMDPGVRGDGTDDDNLAEFLTLAAACDAFVLGTPVYHDSYSGVLKNALDHLGSASLGGKVFGLVSHGGQRTTQAVDPDKQAIATEQKAEITPGAQGGAAKITVVVAPACSPVTRCVGWSAPMPLSRTSNGPAGPRPTLRTTSV